MQFSFFVTLSTRNNNKNSNNGGTIRNFILILNQDINKYIMHY